jgi:argininosuccinate lyase
MTLWGGRFAEETDELVRRFNDSMGFDRRMYGADIRGSVAYAGALARAGLITSEERDQLVAGLAQVRAEFDAGTFQVQESDEDIHTAVERRLGELVGPVAGKLHAGRSRNDQVATDLRLYLLDEMAALREALIELQDAIVEKAAAHLDAIMPGYTHLQQAQPILFSHWLLSFFEKLQRDRDRLADVLRRTAVLPLGAGALAGNPFGIDRRALAAELGLADVTHNSLDAVADRDFCVEFLAWAALLQVHLSALAEDLIIWSSREFGFVQVSEAHATGSSLMPQKRNPDSLELMRGKTGRFVGHLVGLLTVLKGLPSTYNKDLQEDKEAVFEVVDSLVLELPLAAALIRGLEVSEARMVAGLDEAVLATDLADYLVRKGVAFRESHHLVREAVYKAAERGTTLKGLDLATYQAMHPTFGPDLYAVLDMARSIGAHDVEGGTALAAVRAQLDRAKELLSTGARPLPGSRYPLPDS